MTKAVDSGHAEAAHRGGGRPPPGPRRPRRGGRRRRQQVPRRPTPSMVDVLDIDNTKVREQQIARLEQIRADARRRRPARPPSHALREGAAGDGNLLALCIDAARARATVGEMSDAMEAVFGRHKAEIRSISGVYGAAYEGDEGFDGHPATRSRPSRPRPRAAGPRILVAKMGQDGHDRGAKVVGTAFADLGFDVDFGPLFETPAEVARAAVENDVHVVGVSSQAAGHKTLVPQLIAELREAGADDILVVCGGVIPPQDYDVPRRRRRGRRLRPGHQHPRGRRAACSSSSARSSRAAVMTASPGRAGPRRRPAGAGPGHHAGRVDPGRPPRRGRRPARRAAPPHRRRASASGISGAPGRRQVDFIEALGLHAHRRRATGSRCSPSTRPAAGSGGSILGDKTRMADLGRRAEAFIRPVAARRHPRRRGPPHPRGAAAVRGGRLRRRARRDGRRRPVRGGRGRPRRPVRARSPRPAAATSSRASSAGSWSWPTSSSSTRPTATSLAAAAAGGRRPAPRRAPPAARSGPAGRCRCCSPPRWRAPASTRCGRAIAGAIDRLRADGTLDDVRADQAVAWMWSEVREEAVARTLGRGRVERAVQALEDEVRRGEARARHSGRAPLGGDPAAAGRPSPSPASAALQGVLGGCPRWPPSRR